MLTTRSRLACLSVCQFEDLRSNLYNKCSGESSTLLTTETNLSVIALLPLDVWWQVYFDLFYSVSFSRQTLGTEKYWSICRLTDRGKAQIDSSGYI